MPDKTNPGAVELLKEDHEKVKGLFKQFEEASDETAKEELADQVDLELRVHSMIEEEILYPTLRDVDGEIVAESFEDHGVVEELSDQLATMELGEEQFDEKFKVMQENVEHHIEEEETQTFPKASKLPNYEEMGLRLIERKMELMDELRGTESEDHAGSEPRRSGPLKSPKRFSEVQGSQLRRHRSASRPPSRGELNARR